MTIHIYHEDTHTHGLSNSCPRCQEHALHPEDSLDHQNIARLLRGETYSLLDEAAAERLRCAIRIGQALMAIAQEDR